jgi:hypothetical protein
MRIFLLAFLLALLFVAGGILIPTPAIINIREAGGAVFFTANRGTVWSPDACVTLRWQAENIDEVYLNGEAQIGSGEVQDCGLTEAPNLRVIFRDGGERTYTLPIWIVSSSAVVLVLPMFGIITALLYRSRLSNQPDRVSANLSLNPSPLHGEGLKTTALPLAAERRGGWGVRMFLLQGALVIIIALFLHQLPALIDTAATLNWLQASTALADIFSLAGLVIFAILILFARLPHERQISNRTFLLMGIMGAAFILLIVVGTILSVNPRGMYFSDRYVARQLMLRGSKMQGYFAFESPPEVVILGSSRAFTLSPTTIREQTGLTAYNMAVEGGRIEDFLIQARQLQPFPRILLIEVQEGLPREPNDIASRAPLRWLPYMRPETALLTLQKRLEGLIDLDQFAEAIHIANYAELYERQPNEWPRFNADGFAARAIITPSELEQAILTDIGNISPARCQGVDEISQFEVAQLIQIAESQNSAIIFYISPLHPRYYDERLADDPEYQRCYEAFTAYVDALTRQHDRVFFLDYSRLASIDGVDDESGYYDSQHLTEANSRRLIDHAAATIVSAAG